MEEEERVKGVGGFLEVERARVLLDPRKEDSYRSGDRRAGRETRSNSVRDRDRETKAA